jgi:hypothetical protein
MRLSVTVPVVQGEAIRPGIESFLSQILHLVKGGPLCLISHCQKDYPEFAEPWPSVQRQQNL